MAMTIPASEARERFDELLGAVEESGQPVILEQDGKRIAILVSPERFDRLNALQAAADWAAIHELQERNAHLDPDEVFRDVTEIVDEVRQEMYEERLRAAQGRH